MKISGNGLRTITPLRNISSRRIEQDKQLKYKIGVASEHTYTKEDAVRNQYLKQFRFNASLDDFISGKCQDKTFALGSLSPEDVETYSQKLQSDGLSKDIDWQGVKEDFNFLGIDFDTADIVNQKIDYISSRFAVLKKHISNDYTGSEQKAQFDKLNSIYSEAKRTIAETFSKTVGGFFEDNGATNIKKKMYDSLIKDIDNRTEEYSEYLSKNKAFEDIDAKSEQWLLRDDGYMAARLRENMADSVSSVNLKNNPTYSLHDLDVAGKYVKQTAEQYNSLEYSGAIPDEERIGLDLAVQSMKTDYLTNNSGIGNDMASLINQTFNSYMEKYLQRIDKVLDENSKHSAVPGLRRQLNKSSVYNVYNYTIEKYKKSKDMLKSLSDSANYAKQNYLRNHGTSESMDKYHWDSFFDNENSNLSQLYGKSQLSEFQKYSLTINHFIKSINGKNLDLVLGNGGNVSTEKIDWDNKYNNNENSAFNTYA